MQIQAIREERHQTIFSIHVCVGVFGERPIGSVRLKERLTASAYLEILERLTQDILPDVLADIPVQLRVGSSFMHEGAASLFTRTY
jgi:hypothetical protein